MEWGSLGPEDQTEVAGMDPAEFSDWSADRRAVASRQRQEAARSAADPNRGRAESSAIRARVLTLLAIGSFVLLGIGVGVTDRRPHSISTGDMVGFFLVIAAGLCFLTFLVLGVVALVETHRARAAGVREEAMSQEDQAGIHRGLWDWFVRPWPTRKLIVWFVVIFVVLTPINLIVFDVGWAGVARGAIVLVVVGGLCVYWNDRRWRNRAG